MFAVIFFMQMTFAVKVYLAQQVTRALVFMHTAKPPVIHLDLKPSNILVCYRILYSPQYRHLILHWIRTLSDFCYEVSFSMSNSHA